MKSRFAALLLGATLIGLGCSGLLASCAKKGESLTLAGSTAFQPFAEELADNFMALSPAFDISVQGGGSAVGINAAASGAAQIGMADLVVLPKEAEGLQALIVARDGICIIVHPANPIADLSMESIRAVFRGEIRGWKGLGGPDKPITVVSREAGSGTRSSFEKILGGLSLTKDAIIQDSNGTIRETVANDQNAIGYLSRGLLNERIKALKVGGVEASDAAIAAGSYPLVRPVFFLTKGEPRGPAKAFIDYVLGEEGQAAIAAGGLLRAR